ncbi:MAG: thiamine diphosphokinase [Rickettsiales bacterium]|jgi:thiamine pyrophosphokinase|nr:thiamine diphosphokinase [Rickettsiales bacterium]
MKLLFIANGGLGNKFASEFFSNFDHIVCVDGGLNELCDNYRDYQPTFILGDLDSARKDLLEKYRPSSQIIFKDNQDESDLTFALRYFLEKPDMEIDEIVLTGVVGGRIDHTICNILTLRQIPGEIRAKIITASGEELFLVREKLVLDNIQRKTLSLVPLTDIQNLNCAGTRWLLEKANLPFGFVNGISNVADDDRVSISLAAGELLVIINQSI